MLPLECWNIILQECDFLTQIFLISTTNYFRKNLKITNLGNISRKYLAKLTRQILQYSIFDQIEELDVGHNSQVTDVSFMTSLKKLNADGHCGIHQQGISGLNLVELHVGDNSKITDVSFMTSLKILHASGNCGIHQQGIYGLNLEAQK